MNDGDGFVIGAAFTGFGLGLMLLFWNVSVPYSDIHHGIELCKQNGGMASITEDRMGERKVHCNDDAAYRYSSRGWNSKFGGERHER